MNGVNSSEYVRMVGVVRPIWQDLLKDERIAVSEDTNFFDAGGHSLTAMLLVSRLKRQIGQTVPLFALVEHPTLASFAEYLARSAAPAQQIDRDEKLDPQTERLLHYNEGDRRDNRNRAFEQFYVKAMNSRAHATFCERVYGRNLGQHGMADLQQIDTFLDQLRPTAGDVVLDIGCGYGLISKYIADKTGAKVVGIDLSPSAIAYADSLAAADKRLAFHKMDIKDLDFPPNTFSHIVSIDTIYYAPSIHTTLKTLKRIGKPGARLAVVRTFPMRSFTRDTWSPHRTELATLLRETFGDYTAVDFSKEENEHWRKKVSVLNSLRGAFLDEGNQELFDFRYNEATYEAGIEQLRCLFVTR